MCDFIKKALKKPLEPLTRAFVALCLINSLFIIFLKVGVIQAFNQNTLKKLQNRRKHWGSRRAHFPREILFYSARWPYRPCTSVFRRPSDQALFIQRLSWISDRPRRPTDTVRYLSEHDVRPPPRALPTTHRRYDWQYHLRIKSGAIRDRLPLPVSTNPPASVTATSSPRQRPRPPGRWPACHLLIPVDQS